LRYNTLQQQWYRMVYPASLVSIIREPDGNLIAGDTDGTVWQLDTGTQDDGENIPVTIVPPIDSDGTPLEDKTALDLQVDANTGGLALTVAMLLDGSANPETDTYSVTTQGDDIHKQTLRGLADFSRLQLRMTGSFFRFILRFFNVSYRSHPQQVMQIDSGYLQPPGNADFGWIGKVEISTRSPVNLELVPTFDDVEMDALPLVVVPGKTSTYSTILKRGQDKGRRPLLIVRTTNSAGTGRIGFEPYWIRIWWKGTGNQNEKVSQITIGSIAGSGQ